MAEDYLIFVQDQFPFLEHLFRRKLVSQNGVSSHELYLRKKNSRLNRQASLMSKEEVREFFSWIWSIQRKLNMSNREFADSLGVTLQTLKLWRNSHGHFPSQRSIQKILALDAEARKVETIVFTIGITDSRTILGKSYVYA